MATILVVDDVPTNRQFLVTLLGYSSHRLIEAGDGLEGLEQVRVAHPDLVIADILMPTMDGFEFVRQLRADPALAPTSVIFYTAAYAESETRTLAQRCGVSCILLKPSAPETVLQTVNTALGLTVPSPPTPSLAEFDREHLQLLTDKLSQKVTELEAVRLRLEALIDLGLALAAEHDPRHLLGNVCSTARRAYRRRDLQGDPQAVGLPPEHPPVHTFLGVPILTATQVYGWLCLTDKLGAEEFSAADERLAVSLAAQAAVAYENAKRDDEMQRHAAELEQRVKERTAELQRSNAELEQFAYIASHDLQAPLRQVISYTNLLAQHYQDKLDANANEFLDFAVDGATRMQQLIQDLLTYSRVGQGGRAFAPVNCEDVLARVLHNLQLAIQESDAVVTHDPLPIVQADTTQLVQVFQNLVSNALKFRDDKPPAIHIGVEHCDSAWRFAVRDNGIGIEPQYVERIFAIFQRLHTQREYPGTGIGLALCKKIVERHGGRIWVESQPGRGATFYFTLLGRSGCIADSRTEEPL